MRQPTQKEIDNKPDWANSFFENMAENLCWFNDETGATIRFDSVVQPVFMSNVHYAFKTCKRITRKEFDIETYKFSDGDMDVLIEGEGRVLINVDSDRSIFAELSTGDIIALAKHKKLTAEDLK